MAITYTNLTVAQAKAAEEELRQVLGGTDAGEAAGHQIRVTSTRGNSLIFKADGTTVAPDRLGSMAPQQGDRLSMYQGVSEEELAELRSKYSDGN